MLQARLSHVALQTGDLSSARTFYEDIVGLRAAESSSGHERLALGTGAPVLELTPGRGLDHFALEIRDEAALTALEATLRERGVPTRWIEADGGHPRALRFEDPEGHRVELHGRINRSGEGVRADGRRPIGLHHITLSSPDVPMLAGFYEEVLGFAVSDRMADRFIWMRCNREHHTLAIVRGEAGGLDHYCFEVSDWDDLKAWCDMLAVRDVPVTWGPGRHGPGNNLFIMFDDPDAVRVELSCEIERFWDDRVEYAAPRNWAPELRSVNLWGPAPDWRRPVATGPAPA